LIGLQEEGLCIRKKMYKLKAVFTAFNQVLTFLYFSYFWHEKAFSNIKTL